MKKVLVMCNPDPSGNPRPKRAIELCHKLGFTVDILSAPIAGDVRYNNSYQIRRNNASETRIAKYFRTMINLFGIVFFRLFFVNSIRVFFHNYKFRVHSFYFLKNNNYDLLIVEDLTLLPLAFIIRKNAKIVFDAREYYSKQLKLTNRYKLFYKPVTEWICKTYLNRCDALITVSGGLATEYQKEYGVSATVIRSTPYFHKATVKPINSEHVRIVHHGNATHLRKLEKLIDLVELLDKRFTLDFYLNDNTPDRRLYVNKLKEHAKNNQRIHFYKAVPYNNIINVLNNYDIGLFYVEPTTFNLRHTLPNKFFEFIQARLMIAIGPSPDMLNLVEAYNCGVASTEFNIEELAVIINNLSSENILFYKQNSAKAASVLCFEEEGKKFAKIIDGLTNK